MGWSALETQSFRQVELRDRFVELVWRHLGDYGKPDICIRVSIAGVCRSDLKEIDGVRALRRDFGHEFVGEVVYAGDGQLRAVGDKVVFDPHIGVNRTTGFADFVLAWGRVPALALAFPVIPRSIENHVAVFAEPLSCAEMCTAQVCKEAISRVALVGGGMTSALQAILLNQRGVESVVMSRSTDRLDRLANISGMNIVSYNGSSAQSEAFDAVVITHAEIRADTVLNAVGLCRNNGAIYLFGGTSPAGEWPLGWPDLDQLRRNGSDAQLSIGGKQIRIVGVYSPTSGDMKRAIDILSSGKLTDSLLKLTSRTVEIKALPSVFLSEKGSAANVGKTLVDMSL